MFRSLLGITAIVILVSPAAAQKQPSFEDKLSPRRFYIDYVPFKDSLSDSIRVDVFYQVYSSALSYEKRGDKFKASYEVDVVINRKGKQVTAITRDGDLVADTYENTLSRKDFLIGKFVFELPADNYELVGRLVDSYSGDDLNVKEDMKLKDFGRQVPFLSGIEFVRQSEHSTDTSEFHRDGLKLIPSVSRFFGFDDPVMEVYYQIYNKPDYNKDYMVTYEIAMEDKVVMADTSLFPSKGAVTGRLEDFNVESLLPGLYNISINVRSPGGDLNLTADDDFAIQWSVMGIVKNDFKTAVDQLKYIATRDEMNEMKKAPEDMRMELWNAFWKSKDPTPGTPENELRDEYYKRLRYADLNFGNFGHDGWKTDMGMVYITYGSPDEIERHPFDVNSKPYQIWYYYEQKRRFVFVDFNGYGDYELQYPYDGDITRTR